MSAGPRTWPTPAPWSATCAPELLTAGLSACRHEPLAAAGLLGDARLALDLAPDVAHRLDRAYARDHVEVVRGRGGGSEPLERVALPRVRASDRADLEAARHVHDRHQHTRAKDKCADRGDEVVGRPPQVGLVGVDPARHSREPE